MYIWILLYQNRISTLWVETNLYLNPILTEAKEGKVGDIKEENKEERKVLNVAEDINFLVRKSLASLVSVRKSLASRPVSSMTPFFCASFCAFG